MAHVSVGATRARYHHRVATLALPEACHSRRHQFSFRQACAAKAASHKGLVHRSARVSGRGSIIAQGAPPKESAQEWIVADDNDDDDDDDFDEDIEIFNFDTGWNMAAMGDDEEFADEDDEEEEELTTEELLNGYRIPQKLAKRLKQERAKGIKDVELGPQKPKRGTHSRLKLITGRFGGLRLISPNDEGTRPMMEKVRGAVFSIIESYLGCPGGLPENSRWLDLYSGTGAVGLEGMSRGVGEAHFCEFDPWVVGNVLSKNLEKCGVSYDTTVHTMKVEQLLQRAIDSPMALGGKFDFISVTPPYVLVSYPELMALLEKAPIYHENSIILVEYARRERYQIPDTLGPLVKIRDRKYGRTYVAVYGPLDPDDM